MMVGQEKLWPCDGCSKRLTKEQGQLLYVPAKVVPQGPTRGELGPMDLEWKVGFFCSRCAERVRRGYSQMWAALLEVIERFPVRAGTV